MQGSINDKKCILIKTLGEVIAEYRIAKGKTMYKISAEASMSKSTWREAELGICKDINLTTLWKIADGLEIKPAKLLEELQMRLGINFSLTDLD